MLMLHGLGSNIKTGVPYTKDEIMAIVRKGKQRGHLPGIGRVLPGHGTNVLSPPSPPPRCTYNFDVVDLQPQFGSGSGSGGCGDDEPAMMRTATRMRRMPIIRRCYIWIRCMGLESIVSLMGKDIKDPGTKAEDKVLICTRLEMAKPNLEARRAAEKAYDVAKVDKRVNKAVATANRSTNAARVVASGDSYKAPSEEAAKDKGLAGKVSSSTKKKGRTVAITVEDMQKRKNDVKARTTLFNIKNLWWNEATKKTKKNQLKQQYGNFKDERSETLEQTFNRLQAIVGYLKFMDVPIEQDDLDKKFLTSLGLEWLVGSKESRVKLTNMAFISSSNNSNEKCEVPTVQEASTASAQVPTVSTDVATASLSYDTMDIKWNLALLSMRADRFWKKTDHQGVKTEGRERESYKKDPKVEEPDPKAMIAIDGVPTEYALMAKSSLGSDNEGIPHDNINDKGYWDSSCFRHMTGIISYLSEYEPFNGGYVLFGHGRGKITGKGSIKTDFKLVDDKHVFLRTPRQQNMYTINLKNVVPHKNLTCLIVKASVDESMLWHRRLGRLNFKTMNKLVSSNLVKGLPSKSFENDHSCVACLKGKQHKDSCKSKLVNSVFKPLHTLHIDLFRPTSVSSLNHKWILRNFITEIENLKDLNVKIIRSDNGGEFRNKEMDEFCSRKGIKREFSNARTPQQNSVAERRNKTLIEAARTMLANAKLPVTFWAEAVNTVCYVQNRVLVIKPHNMTCRC
nr:hypothetical protein [Tanacetum cinerariifolium]